MENSMEKSLIEVRKAYRLLFDYQSRILDLMSFIEGKIDFNFNGGWPTFTNTTPRAGGGSLDKWAWDWLNMYYYQFYFGEKKIEEKVIRFSIAHMADSGFFENHNQHTDKINLKKYKNVEESSSKLIFVIGSDMWNWGDNWNDEVFTTEPQGDKKDENGGQLIFKSYGLEKFASEESAIATLKDFEKHVKLFNIPFTIKERKIQN